MQFVAFTKDRFGNPGHPTQRFDQIRKLRKRGQIRIVGGGLSGKPVIVVYLSKTFDSGKTVARKFARVIDPGYNNIGYSVCEIKGNCIVVLCRGKIETRIPDIKGLMQDRKMHRSARRSISRSGIRCKARLKKSCSQIF